MRLLMSIVAACVLPIPARSQELRGFADIHNHQFSNLAFGGRIVVGRAFGPMDIALSPSRDRAAHGPRHVRDIVGGLLALRGVGAMLYDNEGSPRFSGWPHFLEVTHQKVHEEWLLRAVHGGMRLMVMLAVDSPALCWQVNTDGRNCDDEMAAVDRQLDDAYAMQAYVDESAGGPGRGWYRIVTTPMEARQVIRAGKLAVVLGIETAHLFGCRPNTSCAWRSQLDKYWGRGVRHFFTVHQGDSAFGGASYFKPELQKRRNVIDNPVNALSARYELTTRPCPQYERGSCNALGLTLTGRLLIAELMRRGAIIDVDHLSDLAFAEVLAAAETRGYPVVASHAGFNEINNGGQDHEGQLTQAELLRIRGVGGMVGLISGQGTLSEVDVWRRAGRHEVAHICGGTSETFAQAFYYTIDRAPGLAVAVGTDFNAPLRQPGPRFGAYHCPGGKDTSRQKWEGRLSYPFLARGSLRQLSSSVSGQRHFDFNEAGLAHVGLLPDFFADLEALGMAPEDLEPLFRSAEAYVKLWERARGQMPEAERGILFLLFGGVDR